jgi:hypothetical protein
MMSFLFKMSLLAVTSSFFMLNINVRKLSLSATEPRSYRARDIDSLSTKVKDFGKVASLLTVIGNAAPVLAGGLSEANEKLGMYGLPPIVFVPPGFNALVSEYGRGNNQKDIKNPILVQFCHPSNWIVAKTVVNNNGESGTVGANDYIKGDSANLYEYDLDSGDKLTSSNKKLIEKILVKALSRKGDVLEDTKVLKVEDGVKDLKGEQYITVNFVYSLNTEAGFLINRQGIASMTQLGNYAEVLVTAATDKRWKRGMEEILKDIVGTFRVYRLNSGIFSQDST